MHKHSLSFKCMLIDGLLVSIIVLFGIVGYFRGFIGEVLRLLVWVGAVFATIYSMTHWQHLLPKVDPLITGAVLFLVYLILFKVIQLSIDHIFKGLSFINQPLGFVFGVLKGSLMIVALSYPLKSLEAQSIVLNYVEQKVKTDPRFKQCESYMTKQMSELLLSFGWSKMAVNESSSDLESTIDTPLVV